VGWFPFPCELIIVGQGAGSMESVPPVKLAHGGGFGFLDVLGWR